MEHTLPGGNLMLVDKDTDANGNMVAKVAFPNQRAFSIQTNGVLPNTHRILQSQKTLVGLSADSINKIAAEVYDYVKEFGSKTQQKSLRMDKFKSGGELKNTIVAPEGYVFFKVGSHRAAEKIKRAGVESASLYNMSLNGTAAEDMLMAAKSDYEKVKDIKGVGAAKEKLTSKGEWNIRGASTPKNLKELFDAARMSLPQMTIRLFQTIMRANHIFGFGATGQKTSADMFFLIIVMNLKM